MFFFDCEKGYEPDNGQNDVKDGSVENYDFDWGNPVEQPTDQDWETPEASETTDE